MLQAVSFTQVKLPPESRTTIDEGCKKRVIDPPHCLRLRQKTFDANEVGADMIRDLEESESEKKTLTNEGNQCK